MTKAERKHLDRLAQYPCVVCGARPVQIHHPRAWVGMGQRASHFMALPVWPECHQGDRGIHGDRSAWRLRKIDEPSALAKVIEWMEHSV
jgi:hypothetical protein